MNGTGANHHENAMIFPIQNIAHHFATMGNNIAGFIRQWDFFLENCWGNQQFSRKKSH
jgi:hypothetical protein